MSNIYTSADQLIGKTPLLELTHIEKEEGLEARVLGKLEYFNPAGSVKDRIAKAMIDDAEQKGLLKPGSVIIEPARKTTGFQPFASRTAFTEASAAAKVSSWDAVPCSPLITQPPSGTPTQQRR